MGPSNFDASRVGIGGAVGVAAAGWLIAGLLTIAPNGLTADGSAAVAGAVSLSPLNADNALISTRVEALDLSKLTPTSYGD